MSHEVAIISGGKGTATEKFAVLQAAGVPRVKALMEIDAKLMEVLSKN